MAGEPQKGVVPRPRADEERYAPREDVHLPRGADPSEVESGELVRRARLGDGAAWGLLVDRHAPLLWAIARSCGLDDADCGDVVQTAWLRLVERIDTIQDPQAVPHWLAVTARREAVALARRRGREAPADPLCFTDVIGGRPRSPMVGGGDLGVRRPACSPEEAALAREQVGRVGEALRALPRRCQDLLRMLALATSYNELAAALDLPVGSIGSARARCLAHLRRRLAT
ncbi:sigma-70 family RNA polymerase sigma factor [Actinomadura logoneensis]|uniref:Sigma-70 family RNA polymerase sigma factor n=1 Tax=Actinomadura logoneensis TaxID=2293572 RepID=A0A372JMA8_9ACTN|nr:sigma-70 family RNA polymerase sigma factor [Actinomadura logoneensis]RFU40966.1 sigma-70 family RNA polymerase sigma factor [Actinomadura logoneensis]